MTTIKDSVHDHIEVDDVGMDLLDTPEMQRLRHIKQLGTASLVYPSANHTRFEHSLGVYHLAKEALAHLGVEGPNAEYVRAAALLHDVGHGPFSHNIEDLIERETGKRHDEVRDIVRDGEIAVVLGTHDLDPNRVAKLVRGEGKFGQLVSGELDVDRMDYLVRDAHHTGVPYGTIDTERLVRELAYVDGELVLAEGNVQTAESLLVARALMNPVVYNHHVARISKSMLQRASERLLTESDISAPMYRRMDDHDLLVTLRAFDPTADLAERVALRDLYKRAVWAEMADVPDEVIDAEHDAIDEFEAEIAAQAGVDTESVVLDVPTRPSIRESTSRVVVNGEIRRLYDQSTLVSALRAAQQNQWRLGVYAPPEQTDIVGQAAESVLDLRTQGALVTEVSRRGVRTTLDEF